MDQSLVEFQDDGEAVARDRQKLKMEQRTFEVYKANEKARMEAQDQLFEHKWKILEAEMKQFAKDKKTFELDKQRRQERRSHKRQSIPTGIFFCGVTNVLALKKRYRDLIKIYHPDNVAGDTYVLQEINDQYEKLKNKL